MVIQEWKKQNLHSEESTAYDFLHLWADMEASNWPYVPSAQFYIQWIWKEIQNQNNSTHDSQNANLDPTHPTSSIHITNLLEEVSGGQREKEGKVEKKSINGSKGT